MITLQQLAAYLPYDIQIQNGNDVFTVLGMNKTIFTFKEGLLDISDHKNKLILRPLSQLTESIVHDGREVNVKDEIKKIRNGVDIYCPSNGDIELNYTTPDYATDIDLVDGYNIMQVLLKYNFNIFNLPESDYIIKPNK
jgi:hypothetical protein